MFDKINLQSGNQPRGPLTRSVLIRAWRHSQIARLATALTVILLQALFVQDCAFAESGRIEVDGTELVFHLTNGTVLRGYDLVDRPIEASGRALRIEQMVTEAQASGGRIFLYHIVAKSEHGRWEETCPTSDGTIVLAMPLKNRRGQSRMVCADSAEARCVAFGYHPWEASDTVPMDRIHEACVRMLRAEYGGDGQPYTTSGVPVQFYDTFGIRKPPVAKDVVFEAAWDENGALCIAHVRARELASLTLLEQKYDRLKRWREDTVCAEDVMAKRKTVLLLSRVLAVSDSSGSEQ